MAVPARMARGASIACSAASGATARFFHGKGLAGQQRLVDLQMAARNQPGVRRDDVPRLEHQQVARNDRRGGDPDLLAIPDHRGLLRDGLLKFQRGLGAARLLEGIEGDAYQHDARDDQGVAHLAQGRRHGARDQEDENQGAGEAAQQEPGAVLQAGQPRSGRGLRLPAGYRQGVQALTGAIQARV
jgi:hypothetical protein